MNPARSYIDPYTYTGGNPLLKPQYTHSLELRHGFKNKLFTAIGASFTSDLVYFVVQPYNSKATQRVPDNVGTSQSYNLTISYPLNIMKGWTMQANLLGMYGRFQYRYRTMPFKAEQISATLNSANAFVFGKGWTGELSGRLNTPAVNVISHADWRGNVDIGIQKVFSSNWRVKLSAQDIFYTNWALGRINVPDYKHRVQISTDTRLFLLNITYSFGNQQLKNSRQRKTAAEEVQRTN